MAAITVTPARKTLFVGSYARLRVSIDPASGTTIDDYEFVVTSGLAGGVVSLARGPKSTPHEPSAMLLGGYEPGVHFVQVLEKATATVVAEFKYRLTTRWRATRRGPSSCCRSTRSP